MSMFKFIKPTVPNAEHMRVMLQIGCTIDLMVGNYVILDDGEAILNGGLSRFEGIAGPPNSNKTTILRFMVLQAMDRLLSTTETAAMAYDTENTWEQEHILQHLTYFPSFKKYRLFIDGILQIINKDTMYGDVWFEEFKKWVKSIIANKSKLLVKTMFMDRTGKKPYKVPVPTFAILDSVTEFEDSGAAKIQDDVKLGDSKGLTLFMKMGLAKVRMLSSIGTISMRSNTYLSVTSHVGKEHAMSQGPMSIPEKKLATMKPGEKLKGVTDKFYTLLVHLWRTDTAVTLKVSSSDRRIKYPRIPEEIDEPMGDLLSVKFKLLRSKTSPSGVEQKIIVSQKYGVQPTLTEFDYIKEGGRYGLDGGTQFYNLHLYPKVKISRTKIRMLIDTDDRLRRAINITSEMLQIFTYKKYDNPKLVCSPEQLYVDIDNLGYDWDKLLDSRGWHTLEDSKHPVPAISTMSILRIRCGLYENKLFLKDNRVKKK